MSKKIGDWPKIDRFIFLLAFLAVIFSWPWLVAIILDDSTPAYIRQACTLFLAGVSVAWYYTAVKHGEESN